jgi:hypothetical protein
MVDFSAHGRFSPSIMVLHRENDNVRIQRSNGGGKFGHGQFSHEKKKNDENMIDSCFFLVD